MKLILVTPDFAHFRAGIAGDQGSSSKRKLGQKNTR
jgi:hypothetical protein